MHNIASYSSLQLKYTEIFSVYSKISTKLKPNYSYTINKLWASRFPNHYEVDIKMYTYNMVKDVLNLYEINRGKH